jgi:hypothetical protein
MRLALVENENRLRQAVRNIARCLSSEGKTSIPPAAEAVANPASKPVG